MTRAQPKDKPRKPGSAAGVDAAKLAQEMKLIDSRGTGRLRLIDAVCEPPTLAMTIDGSSTISLKVADHDRTLITTDTINERSWANIGGLPFELVKISKAGDFVTLSFEDALVAALRRHTKPLSAPANTTTRRAFAMRLCREARIPYLIDPGRKEKVHNPLQRSADGQKSNSWEVLGSEVAEPINWRRFSDGRRIVIGSDEWLISTYAKPITIREHTDGVGSIDFDLDVGKPAATAKVTLDTRLMTLLPGAPVKVEQLGPGSGLWIVSDFTRKLTSTRGDLTLTRKTHELDEPKAQRGAGKRDSGDPDYVPSNGQDNGTTTATTPPAGNAAREKMVGFALAQQGKPYVWGASGPGSYDCSGLVQAAVAAAGGSLPKPSASQWAACQRAGKTITVAAALATRGALLFRIGVGTYNHVAISLGNGSTMEARGSAYGCGVFGSASAQGWTGGAVWL